MPNVPIGVVLPGGGFGEGTNALIPGSPVQGTQNVVLGRDAVWIHSDDPVIDVVARLTGKPTPRSRAPTTTTPPAPARSGSPATPATTPTR
jgi:hypothetical protein